MKVDNHGNLKLDKSQADALRKAAVLCRVQERLTEVSDFVEPKRTFSDIADCLEGFAETNGPRPRQATTEAESKDDKTD